MNTIMTPQEQLSLTLRGLYQSYGYRQYKVSRFEEYDLYARNKNFLESKSILTFSDTNGRLMALKPDVTLSIIKNTRRAAPVRKVWYTENVYRVPRNAYGFQEIMQTGLECIGQVDAYAMSEVLMLAARSLAAISPDYVLALSHMGILGGILSPLPEEIQRAALAAMGEKNAHSLAGLGLAEDTRALLEKLALLSGPADEALPQLLTLPLPDASRRAAEELGGLCRLLGAFGPYRAELDLSVVSDTDYYNGLIFRGYVDGVAAAVLSGGRYDNLLHRMGKEGAAVGFAVYLSELERFFAPPPDFDADVLVTYTPQDDPMRVAALAKKLAESGQTVRVQPQCETSVTCRRTVSVGQKEG